MTAPFASLLFRAGWAVGGILLVVAGVATAVFAAQAKADGQSIPRYLLAAMRGRIGRHPIGGDYHPVYVGLSKVHDFHHSKAMFLERSAVEINPDLVDARGHVTMPGH